MEPTILKFLVKIRETLMIYIGLPWKVRILERSLVMIY